MRRKLCDLSGDRQRRKSRLEPEDWPENWFAYPYPTETQNIGDQWLHEANEFGLILPSAAVANGLGEIIIVNPTHELTREIRLVESIS